MKKALRQTQTLRAKKFRPAADPLPGAQDRQNLISWRWSLPAPTDPVWWRSMHAISSYRGNRGNRHRPPARYKHTHRQDRLQYTAPLASAQCNQINRSAWLRLTGYITVALKWPLTSSRTEVESKSNRSCNHRLRDIGRHLRNCSNYIKRRHAAGNYYSKTIIKLPCCIAPVFHRLFK